MSQFVKIQTGELVPLIFEFGFFMLEMQERDVSPSRERSVKLLTLSHGCPEKRVQLQRFVPNATLPLELRERPAENASTIAWSLDVANGIDQQGIGLAPSSLPAIDYNIGL